LPTDRSKGATEKEMIQVLFNIERAHYAVGIGLNIIIPSQKHDFGVETIHHNKPHEKVDVWRLGVAALPRGVRGRARTDLMAGPREARPARNPDAENVAALHGTCDVAARRALAARTQTSCRSTRIGLRETTNF
jgi:hypothetical protein